MTERNCQLRNIVCRTEQKMERKKGKGTSECLLWAREIGG